MLKKLGLFALMSAGVAGALLPTAAYAQDDYYGRRNYYNYDRNWDRHEHREWKEHEREERREREWRERQWRQQEWREHEWREHERWEHRFDRGYYPDSYFYFGYGR